MIDVANGSALLPQARSFIFKILEQGDKYYYPEENDKGTIHLSLEIAVDITKDLVGKPIIIGHKKLTEDNIDNQDEIVVGRIVRTFVNEAGFETAEGEKIASDNSTYAEGFIDKQAGLDCIEKGYLPSIYYTILEEKQISKDKVEVLGAVANHLGLVEHPKYDTSIYLNDKINQSQYNIMNKNARNIANGYYTDKTNMKNSEEPTMDEEVMQLDNTYFEAEPDYSIAEIWEVVKEDIENNSMMVYKEPKITLEGVEYDVNELIALFKEKKKMQSEAEQVENSNMETSKEDEVKKDVMNSAAQFQPSVIKRALNAVKNLTTQDTAVKQKLEPAVTYFKKS